MQRCSSLTLEHIPVQAVSRKTPMGRFLMKGALEEKLFGEGAEGAECWNEPREELLER